MLTTVGLSYDSPCCSFGCNNFSLNIKELKRYSSWETWITVTRITTWRFKNRVGILLCFSVHSCLLFVYVHCLIFSITYIKNLMRCNYTDQSIKTNFSQFTLEMALKQPSFMCCNTMLFQQLQDQTHLSLYISWPHTIGHSWFLWLHSTL